MTTTCPACNKPWKFTEETAAGNVYRSHLPDCTCDTTASLRAELAVLRELVEDPSNDNRLSWCKFCDGLEQRLDFSTVERFHKPGCPWKAWKEKYGK